MTDEAGIYRNVLETEGNFTTVSNAWIRGSGLTPQANFLWVYLLSHKVGYELRDTQILAETGFGPKGLRSARKELVDQGWLKLERKKNPDGSLGTYAYHLQEPRVPLGTVAHGTVPEGTDLKRLITNKTNSKKEERDETLFEEFWAAYPNKTDKVRARKSFARLTESKKSQAVEGAKRFADDPNLPPKRFIPYPATWLNNERWEDGPLPARTARAEKVSRQEENAARLRELLKGVTND